MLKIYGSKIVTALENLINWYRNRRERSRIRHQQKYPPRHWKTLAKDFNDLMTGIRKLLQEWAAAFLQAAIIVLLINQFFVQAYQIPSASMRNTLLEGDHIFVNKIIYGPQLLPGLGKIPGFSEPQRGEIIIFENPRQNDRGTLFHILHRSLYMLTLSLVDIDRDAQGNARASLLIKRAVGMGRDRIRSINGNMYIKPAGASRWLADHEILFPQNPDQPIRRTVPADAYIQMKTAIGMLARLENGIRITDEDREFTDRYTHAFPPDMYSYDMLRTAELSAMNPMDMRYSGLRKQDEIGLYLPSDTILCLGDNRDNSLDGRSFGFISKDDILGRAMFIYWPPQRWQGLQ